MILVGIKNRMKLPGRTGFTLVEMMMVVLLIGLLASISAPPIFRYLADSRLQTNADRMAADLQYARSMSITNGNILRFSANNSGYTLTNPLDGKIYRSQVFSNGMGLESIQSTDFFPWGMADTKVFTLKSGTEFRKITVLPTGMVEVAHK